MDRQRDQDPPRPLIPAWIWWLVLIGLVVWNVSSLRQTAQPQADIPYSLFLTQVHNGNVTEITLNGDQITGTVAQAILWPEPTPVVTAAAGGSAITPVPTAATPPAATTTASATATEAALPAPYLLFRTTFPEVIGDPTLMALLHEHGVVVNVAAAPSPWLQVLFTNGLPLILLLVVMVILGRRTTRGQSDGLLGFGRTRARHYDAPEAGEKGVTFDDVAGVDEAKGELMDIVDFLREPDKYHAIGAHIPRGVLLVGPPGTGKTLMARAIAGEAHVPFYSLSASEFVEMFVGVGASRVRDLFSQAKETAPSIVFIDELDAVGRRRGAGLGAVNDEREQTLNQLLVEMDGFDERHEIIVVAATNRPDVLDPALLRPGRFDRQVTIGLPDRRGRGAILGIHTRGLQLAPDVDLEVLARTTTGFSGADLANLCNEAALIAARANQSQIDMQHFEEALDKTLLGGVRPLLLDAEERRAVAYHEAGHALAAWLTPEADSVRKVTIIPRGRALGVTEQLPGEDHYNYGRKYLLARLKVMLGGRAAETVALDDITTGAESDLIEATRLARRMVTRWGMGVLGPMVLQSDDQQPFLGYELTQGRDYSERTAATIDQAVQALLVEQQQSAADLLTAHRDQLDRVVAALLHEETIDEAELTRLLGERLRVNPGREEVPDAIPNGPFDDHSNQEGVA